jgi:hypothetical protein
MGLFTLVTTNVRAKRAAVVLYAVILFSLIAYGNFVFAAESPYLLWTTAGIGLVAIAIVGQVSRGRLDHRLARISAWLVLSNVLILALYVAVYWRPISEILR